MKLKSVVAQTEFIFCLNVSVVQSERARQFWNKRPFTLVTCGLIVDREVGYRCILVC
jgi:hypothetical protein